MTAFRKSIGVVVLLACVCATASATTYNFTVTSGEWCDQQNWQLQDPASGDSVIVNGTVKFADGATPATYRTTTKSTKNTKKMASCPSCPSW